MMVSEEDSRPGGSAIGVLLFCSALIVLLVAAGLIGRKILIADEGRHEVLHAEADATARAARAYTTRALRGADLALIGFANAIKTQKGGGLDTGTVERLLAEYRGNLDDEFWLLFLDANGIGVASSEDLPVKGVSYADRDYYRAHASGQYAEGVFVGALTQGRVSNRPLFVLSRRVESADGKFAGVIAAPMNIASLAEALAVMRINPSALITLKDRTGNIIARAGPEDGSLREPAAQDVDFFPIDGGTVPAIHRFAAADAVGWARSEETMSPLPLKVAVEIPSEIWTPGLKADVAVGSAGLLFMTGVLLLSGYLAFRLSVSLERSEARYRQLYTSMQDGVVLVDGEGRIEDCNQAFLDLTGCTREELTGASFARWGPLPWRTGDEMSMRKRSVRRFPRIGVDRDYVQRTGRIVHVNVKMWRIRKEAGSRVLFCALVRDVSEVRRAQKTQQDVHAALERKVQQRTMELTQVISLMRSEIVERKQIEDKLRHSQDQLRKLAARREDIREAERQRIAREIHDELGGFLTVIKANISTARQRSGGRAQEADGLLADAMEASDRAIEALRRVIADLRPSVLDHLGVWAALRWYANQVRERTGLECTCVVDESLNSFCLNSDHETMIFRITQEALTNVIRHAGATRAAIRAFRLGGNLVVEVEDNGKGIEAHRLLGEESWGILGMHERTRHFGGELRISGMPGQGTVVVLRIPLEGTDVLQEDSAFAC